MMVNINLLPRSTRRLRREWLLLAAGAALLLGGSWGMVAEYQQASLAKQQTEKLLADVKARKQALLQQVAQANQQASEIPEVERLIELPRVIGTASVPTHFLLDRLGDLMPTGGMVTSLEFESPDIVKVNVTFASIEEAVSFIKAVETSPYFLMKSVGSVIESNAEASKGFLPVEGEKAASVYTISFEMKVKRNTVAEQTAP